MFDARAEPAKRVALEDELVHGPRPGLKLLVVDQVVEDAVGSYPDTLRLGGEIVEKGDGRAPPAVANPEHRARARREDRPLAPADLRALLAKPDHADHPAERRLAVASLQLDIHELRRVRPLDGSADEPIRAGEASIRIRRPLHGRADRGPLLQ